MFFKKLKQQYFFIPEKNQFEFCQFLVYNGGEVILGANPGHY